MNNWDTMIKIRGSMKERYCNSTDTLTLLQLGLNGGRHGLIGMKWPPERERRARLVHE